MYATMTGLNILIAIWGIALAGGVCLLIRSLRKNKTWDFKLVLLAVVFLLILLARMAVNLCAAYDPESESLAVLNRPERLLDSIVHTFQSFSMDEDYTTYTVKGKEMFSAAYGTAAAKAYGAIISFLNVLAPLLGGAVLLDILTGIFPRLRILLHPRRRKFVFSELNEAAITLAEDLYKDKQYKDVICPNNEVKRHMLFRPLLIFAGTDGSGAAEEKESLISRAKSLRAVCIKTDFLHLPLRHSKSVYYILISETEQVNIAAVADIHSADQNKHTMWPAGEEKFKSKKTKENEGVIWEARTKVFAFCQSNMGEEMINQINEKQDTTNKTSEKQDATGKKQNTSNKDGKKQSTLMVRPLRDYANSVINLMYHMPMFVPFLKKEGEGGSWQNRKTRPSQEDGNEQKAAREGLQEDTDFFQTCLTKFKTQKNGDQIGGIIPTKDLHVTILGSGSIAEEAFFAAFWCGQIADYQLHIHVLSLGAGEMEARIRTKCPELFDTCDIFGKGVANLDALRIYPHTDSLLQNPPYAIIDGFDKSIDVTHLQDPEFQSILDKTHYYIVALGDDERDIYVSTLLKRELARKAMDKGEENRHPVIALAVFNQTLADEIKDESPEKYEPYIYPFATLESRFSCRNVFMTDTTAEARETKRIYDAKKEQKPQKEEYYYWANESKTVHALYKLFGLGCVKTFNPLEAGNERFGGTSIPTTEKERSSKTEKKLQREEDELAFSWMEHRRWNAYMRVQGFILATPDQYWSYYNQLKDHKDLKRKLHNCLVESSLRGNNMPDTVEFDEAADAIPDVSMQVKKEYDALDVVSIIRSHLDWKANNSAPKDDTKEKEQGANPKQEAKKEREDKEYKQWDTFDSDRMAQRLMDVIASNEKHKRQKKTGSATVNNPE